ncbi:putative toxin-antitoxin system toxin component, PIN family [Dyadobacter chenwenxiniae]|uniref:Toxin-antitoxin system toxin component, PIN family n=1 Tax=Dyadobacter chenwenxiniae TaxID=2906456 RepID=A0A9X1TD43_9BACT|nr:putative toxin-antitoxin system toxin component, PIN family [Dyadobacter chenwenxiniae]MCF0060369.1 putative toxin-antitoxin system toxin component, PIN family [Dyadobacter chenwenxiniae]UON86102.1 putative toxin-antitoxin system toxin component, PIN family [Dyadobacter chenwenxiniae]
MKVVIDTNLLWVSISSRSSSHWIFQNILGGNLTLCVTNEILEEYAEIIDRKLGHAVSEAVLSTFDNLPNIEYVTRHFRWFAVKSDPDDDKFVDCCVASGAVCIVTEDNHFNVVKTLEFPKVLVMSLSEFEQFFNTEK